MRKTEWALDTERQAHRRARRKARELAETVRLLDRAEATVVERTDWAQQLDAQLAATRRRSSK